MNNSDTRVCVRTAEGLLTARATENEAEWAEAWERIAHDAGRAQLAVCLLCCALEDAPKHVDRTGAWNDPFIAAGQEIGRTAEGRKAIELISAAHLLRTFRIQREWHASWEEFDEDVCRALVDVVVRTWFTAIPMRRPAMRAMLSSLQSLEDPDVRRWLRLTVRYYRKLPGNLWRVANGNSPVGWRGKLEQTLYSLRRNHDHDFRPLPVFDQSLPIRWTRQSSRGACSRH